MNAILCHLCRHVSVPPLVLSDVAVLELPHSGLQNLAGIVGKVQVSDLRQRNRHDGKRLFVLFGGAGANLLCHTKKFPTNSSMFVLLVRVSVSVGVCLCDNLEHNWTLLLCIDGDIGARHPSVGAEVPKSHIGVSEEGWDKYFTPK